jgi:predicted enzyme related to lactoylglutathione lyase
MNGAAESGAWQFRRATLRLAVLLALGGASVGPASAAEKLELPPLTTASSTRLPGKFVWADLVTDDVPAARKFYARMFGWTFREVGNYTIAANDERPLGGMFQRAKPANSEAKPRWFGYVSVSSVSRAQKAVIKAGGKVLAEPNVMPQRGEQAVFADPEGAIFGVIKSQGGDPLDFQPDVGDWVWIQLLSRDGKKAAEFYSAVAGYEVVENTGTNRLSDYVLTSKGFARATVRTIPADGAPVKPNWLPFVRVKNVTESVAQAKELGGKVWLEPKPELFGGKVAIVADPTGGAIGLLELDLAQVEGGQK